MNEITKNVAFMLLGFSTAIGVIYLSTGYKIGGVEARSPIASSPPVTPEKDAIVKPIYREEEPEEDKFTCNCDQAKVIEAIQRLSKRIDNFPHGVTQGEINNAVKAAFDRRPCITYKELEKHFNTEDENIFD